jgi:tetratricopeptide (TPR) repeat protein
VAGVSVLAVTQPWRAEQRGEEALQLADERDLGAARAAASDANDLNPLSVEPYFELAVVEEAAGNDQKALAALQRAVQVEPSSAEAWRRLGDFYLAPLSAPDQAIQVLRGALFLDPLSNEARASFVAALRAEQALAEARSRPSRAQR